MSIRVNLDKLPKPSTQEQLKTIFNQLDTETQVSFGALAAQVLMFAQNNNIAAAQMIIQGAEIPLELEPVRTQMLEVFPSA